MEPRTPQKRTVKGDFSLIQYNGTGDFPMERSLFGFIIRYSKRDQLLIVPLVVASMVVYYLSLDLPKTIINQAIQGVSFPSADSVKRFLGLDLERIPYLFALWGLLLGRSG